MLKLPRKKKQTSLRSSRPIPKGLLETNTTAGLALSGPAVQLRRCISCRSYRPKGELIQVLRQTKLPKTVFAGEAAPLWVIARQLGEAPPAQVQGRSAYICPMGDCLHDALARKRLSRMLKCPLPPDTLARLEALKQQPGSTR